MTKETCMICDKQFKRLATHLKVHDIDKIDYYKLYNRDKYLLELQEKVINENYISYRRKYILMIENKSVSTKHRSLTDKHVRQHIKQGNRLGVKFGQVTNFIGIDIDVLDIDVLENTYNTLINYGIPENSILCSFSGNKGYHVDIFLNDFIDKKVVQAFHKIILNDLRELLLKLNHKKEKVEIRGGNDQGYFLPFSINYKGSDNKHYGYCGVVNKFGIMEYDIEKEIELLEQIQKADSNIIQDIVDINYSYIEIEEVDTEKASKEVSKELERVELLDIYNTSNTDMLNQIANKTIIEPGTRHRLAFVYGIALRDKGLDEEEIYVALIDWHGKVKGYSSSKEEVEQDCKSISKSVMQKEGRGYKYNSPNNSRPHITKQDIEQFARIENVAHRRIYLALVIHSNTFNDGQGIFYMTYEQIKGMLGIQARNGDILKYIDKLEQQGFIEIIERDRRQKGSAKHKPNIYRVIHEVQEHKKQDIYYLVNDRIKRIEVEKAINEMFSEREFRSIFKNKGNMNNILRCLVA